MELILASGTPKNFKLFRKSCLSTDLAPVMKLSWKVYLPALSLDHRADGAAEGSVLVLGCFLSPDKVMFAAI
jgi:hypothetical protein